MPGALLYAPQQAAVCTSQKQITSSFASRYFSTGQSLATSIAVSCIVPYSELLPTNHKQFVQVLVFSLEPSTDQPLKTVRPAGPEPKPENAGHVSAYTSIIRPIAITQSDDTLHVLDSDRARIHSAVKNSRGNNFCSPGCVQNRSDEFIRGDILQKEINRTVGAY